MTKWITATSRSSGSKVYHTDKDCRNLQHEPRKTTDKEIETRGLRICEVCNSHTWKYYRAAAGVEKTEPTKECPFCGEKLKRLPNHLPCSESP